MASLQMSAAVHGQTPPESPYTNTFTLELAGDHQKVLP